MSTDFRTDIAAFARRVQVRPAVELEGRLRREAAAQHFADLEREEREAGDA